MEWPDDREFAICLTHDVDRVRKYWWHSLYYALKTNKRIYHMRTLFDKRNPYWDFERIMDIEERYGVRSTFFFLNESLRLNPLKPSTFKLSLGRYSVSEPAVMNMIRILDRNGWEIGVHGSYNSYRDAKLLAMEKSQLERIVGHRVIGIRQHYLNLEVPTTWRIQREVGFKYDASFGYRRDVGFREGKLLPFRPFGDEDDFLVIPLAIMDSALFTKYKSLENAWKAVKDLLKHTKHEGALLTVLWHQRVFNEEEFPGWSTIYERLIQEGQKLGAWFGTCEQVYRYIQGG